MSTNKEDYDNPEDAQDEDELSEDDLEEAAGGRDPWDGFPGDSTGPTNPNDEIEPLGGEEV